MNYPQDHTLIQKAAKELEDLRKVPKHDGLPFPRNCRRLLYQIPGNSKCIDCNQSSNPEWASVTYGILLCVNCSGRHRSYGVQTSRVRSIAMDTWSHTQVLALLEGGNHQMKQFFQRHQMNGESDHALDLQYRTKAARFYRTNLDQHVNKVAESGLYHGRDTVRNGTSHKPQRQGNTTTINVTPSRVTMQDASITVQ